MPPTMQSFGIERLSVEDRLALVQEIWDSIAASPEQVPLTDAQRQELQRRLDAHAANQTDVIRWEAVRDEALARFHR